MAYLNREASRTLNLLSGRSGHLFGGKYYWSLIDSPLYYVNAIKYVYRNPVKAGLVARVEDYPHSTITCLAGRRPLRFPLFAPAHIAWAAAHSDRIGQFLEWLNRAYPESTQEALRKALRKPKFHLPVKRSSRREIELDGF
jgi:putative transposase